MRYRANCMRRTTNAAVTVTVTLAKTAIEWDTGIVLSSFTFSPTRQLSSTCILSGFVVNAKMEAAKAAPIKLAKVRFEIQYISLFYVASFYLHNIFLFL